MTNATKTILLQFIANYTKLPTNKLTILMEPDKAK